MKVTGAIAQLIVLIVPLTAGAQETKTASNTSRVLTGGVSHSDQLPALPDDLQAGSLFSEVNLQKSFSSNGSSGVRSGKQITPVMTPSLPVNSTRSVKAVKLISPVKTGAVNTGANMSPQAASKRMKEYLSQQAKMGNGGTIGLKNYTGYAQPILPHKAALTGGLQSASINSDLSRAGRNTIKASTNAQLKRFQIPEWLVGNWNRSESNELSRITLPDHKNIKAGGKSVTKVTDTFGTYKDEKGRYWQIFDPSKTTGSVDRGDATDYHTVRSYNLSITTPGQVLVTLRSTHVVVSKSTHRIIKSYQDEELNSFNEIDKTKLRTNSSTKVFDFKGKPVLLTKSVSFETK